MLPKDCDGILVTEKSVSVSNLINGATRLQPVVMQLGQTAGAWAALSVKVGCELREIPLRVLQEILLNRGCYLMPYLDLKPDDLHFDAIQRIGATGILHGEGRNVGWANQTWLRTDDPLLSDELFLEDYYPGYIVPVSCLSPVSGPGTASGASTVSVGAMESIVRDLAAIDDISLPEDFGTADGWKSLCLSDYDPSRPVTRLEAAVLFDSLLDPFSRPVSFTGQLL